MEKIQARSISILMPLLFGMVFTVIMIAMRKPILHEIMIALYTISFVYFVFIFSCLYFNIGFKRSRKIEFEDIPGLTKNRKWFHELRQADGSSWSPDVDDPAAFLIGIVICIIAPTILAVVIFVFSGAIEIIVFMGAAIFYYSFFKALRIQVLRRKETKKQFIKSLVYSLFYTIITIGFLPLILNFFNYLHYH